MCKFQIYRVEYPFLLSDKDTVSNWGTKWTPGSRQNFNEYDEDLINDADANGYVLYEIKGIYKPFEYPERTFYTRKYQDPDGNIFGKNNLRIISSSHFKTMLKGYRYKYEIDGLIYPSSKA